MAGRIALLFLAVASPLLLLAPAVGPPLGDWLFTLTAAAFPVALIAVGAGRRGGLGPLRLPLLLLLLILEGSMAAMLLLRGQVLEAPWLLGLPLATAVQLYGLFLAPLFLVAFAYALTFDRFGLRRDELASLRRRFPRRGVDPEADGGGGG